MAEDLDWLRDKDAARPIVNKDFFTGIIRFDFISKVCQRETDPEKSFPAMLVNFGSLAVVCASWPEMPARTACRVLSAYVQELEQHHADARDSAEQRVLVICGNFPSLPVLTVENVAVKNECHFVCNGSHVVFVPAGSMNKVDIHPLQCLDPCISMVTACSVEQPARDAMPNARKVTLKENTPLYDNFLDAMKDSVAGREIMDFIATVCFFGDHRHFDDRGNKLSQPRSIGFKMEVMLQTVLHQRRVHIDRLVSARDPRVSSSSSAAQLALTTLPFTEQDMRTLMNTWRLDVDIWMNQDTLARYRNAGNSHKIGKSAFSVYLQHLSGCKFLLRRLIALPIVSPPSSAAQPVKHEHLLQSFFQLSQEWNTYKNSDEHQGAIQRSRQSGQHRLSIRVRHLQAAYRKAAMNSQKIKNSTINFWDLSEEDQRDVEDFDCGRGLVTALRDLLDAQLAQPRPYPGAGVVVQTTSLSD